MIRGGGAGLASLAIVCSAVMWGLWWIPVRALDGMGLTGGPLSVMLYATAAFAMVPLLVSRRSRGLRFDGGALAAGALFGFALAGWNHALLSGTVVRVTLLFYTAPAWATLFGFLFLGDRPTARRALSIAFGLAGAGTILGAGLGDLPLPRDEADWLAISGGAAFAGSATITRSAGGTAELERTAISFALAAPMSLALVPFLPAAAAPPPDADLLPALALAAAVAILYLIPLTWLMMWGAGRLDPGRVAILLLLEVVTAAASAALLTDEPFGPREWLGGALILIAAVLEAGSAAPAGKGAARRGAG